MEKIFWFMSKIFTFSSFHAHNSSFQTYNTLTQSSFNLLLFVSLITSLHHVIFFTPQKFILLHKQFWFKYNPKLDNSKKRLTFFLRSSSLTFCAKTNSSFTARAGWRKKRWKVSSFHQSPCLLYLIQTPYQALLLWDCSV